MGATSPLVVFDTERAPGKIVGHLWGSFAVLQLEDGWKRTETRTECGRLLYVHEWRDLPPPTYSESREEWRAGHVFMRLDVVALVGRVCTRCHPGDEPA